ncbi:hypothetical protein AAVH_42082, partial [Aphelenchoides avenae]
VGTLTRTNDELRQRNKSLGEDCEKLAQALTSSKSKYVELMAAHEQLKQAVNAKKEKLVEANAALATSYQEVDDLRRRLADAETKNASYSELFDKAKNIGEKAPQ